MSKFEEINHKELFNQLQGAIAADKQYWLQNDAKIKAIVTSKSYDEFREIVAAAHLQPIKRNEKTQKQKTWNPYANCNSTNE